MKRKPQSLMKIWDSNSGQNLWKNSSGYQELGSQETKK